MGELREAEQGVLLVAIMSRHAEAHQWAAARCAQRWGPLVAQSPLFDFSETQYYAASMGTDLLKSFVVPGDLADLAHLADWKRLTNDWETEYAQQRSHPEPRPLNLDPGYITLGKLVLASTKNHAHRVYLRDGIYAELTLQYRQRAWRSLPWTYPDYQRADFQQFFSEVRDGLYQRVRSG